MLPLVSAPSNAFAPASALVDPPALLALADQYNQTGLFSDTFMISALTGDGVEDLAKHLASLAPEGPWLFPEDQIADAPARVAPPGGASWLQIGEIVHQVVRRDLPKSEDELRAVLRRLAWESGLIGETENRNAVVNAYDLIRKIRRSEVFEAIARARTVYREVPFVYRSGARTVHGVIDLLLQNQSGQWIVVDYKTAWLGESPSDPALEEHARRYHLQMGVYAAAIRELVGVAPIVYIHYIRYATTVMISEADWTGALARLDGYVGDAIEHG